MDAARVREVHPAFPFIIKQLSSDEAKIIAKLNVKSYRLVYFFPSNKDLGEFGERETEVDEFPKEELILPENVEFYMAHLNLLGVAGIFQVGNQRTFYEVGHPELKKGTRVRSEYRLTEIGKRLARACLGTSRL